MGTRNYAVPPGSFLEEWIEDEEVSQQALADRLGVSRKLVNEIINGRASVTSDTAIKLERVTTIPATTWLKYESAYQSDKARIADQQNLAQYVDHIPSESATYLRKLGATKATKAKPDVLVADFLRFHRCGTWAAYESYYESLNQGDYALAALKEARSDLKPTLLTPWLRAGQLTEEFERGRSYRFDPKQLRDALPDLRERVSRPDSDLLNDVGSMLAEVGVVFLVLPAPKKLPLRGMTAWIDERVPVIQQTGRWRKDGPVIWALFHEIGHVLCDPRGEAHLDTAGKTDRKTNSEKQANKFAHETLFGPAGLEPFKGLRYNNEISARAREVGVAAGLAVARMHQTRLLPYSHGNSLCVDLGDTFTLA